jgi:mannose-6-phosphate isomerase-like protein (cupin superfamily)
MIKLNSPVTRLRDVIAGLDHQQGADLKEIGRSGGEYALVTKSVTVVKDGRNRVAAITSPEGSPSDPHLHHDFNEWWVVMEGEVTYQIGQYEPFAAHFGDIVIAPCGYRHDVRPTRGRHCVRMVVGPEDSNHDLKGIEPSRLVPLDGMPPPNRIFTPLEYMAQRHGLYKAWTEVVLLDQRNRATMIHQMPGESNRPHWHPNSDEWWVVLKGELEWKVGERPPFRAGKGDVVYVEAGLAHEIMTVGEESSIRLAVTTPDRVHYYLDDPKAPKPPRQ